MEQFELLRYVCGVLEELGIRYFITGSQATIVFGEPRFTNDIDIVVELDRTRLDAFLQRFPTSDYYVSRDAARDAISRKSVFNIIHPTSGLKIDVIIPGATPYERERFERARRVRLSSDFTATFSSPEDVIVKKLEFFQMGESDKHLRDIAGVLKISGASVDRSYIAKRAAVIGSTDLWLKILAEVEAGESSR